MIRQEILKSGGKGTVVFRPAYHLHQILSHVAATKALSARLTQQQLTLRAQPHRSVHTGHFSDNENFRTFNF